MRHGYLLLVAAGCGFRSPTGGEQNPSIDGGVAETHVIDATSVKAGQFINMTFDAPRSALTPNAYTYGGLVAHGLQGMKLWQHGDTAWSDLDGKSATGAGLWCGEELKNGVRLDYLGVVNDTTMTLWLEGEVWLDGGAGETFHVNGDDVAFVDLAMPGTTAYVRIAENASAAVTESGPGWYPIRVGFANGDGTFDFSFTHIDPGGGEIPWTRDRLRARTSELSGALRTVFGHQLLAGGQDLAGGVVAPPVPHFEQDKLLGATTFGLPPQGADSDNNDWSARYLGQLYITMPGSYTLRIDSRDGNRGRIGGARAEFAWSRNTETSSSGPPIQAMLGAGWNDLTLDYNQSTGGRLLRAQIQGPDFANLVEIPRDQLRPVEPSDDRLAVAANAMPVTIPDNGGLANPGSLALPVVGYASAAVGVETVAALELTYRINSPHWDQIRVDLVPPGSATGITIRDDDNSLGNNDQTATFAVLPGATSGLLGVPASGTWTLVAYDDVPGGGGNTSSLISARLTLHTTGGPEKIARTASWISPVIDATTSVLAIDGVTWTERIPPGATIQIRLATCQHATCDDAAWSDPVTQGMPVKISRARYLELRVDMTSNGSQEPELRSPAIMLRRDPGPAP